MWVTLANLNNQSGYGPPGTYKQMQLYKVASNADVSNSEFWDMNLRHYCIMIKYLPKHRLSRLALLK